MNNQRGFITMDFIFAIVLILGFTAMLFVLSLTLTMAAVTQYITYAAARNYVVAHLDESTQEKRGQAKYQELIANKVFKPMFSQGWYKVDATAYVGDVTKVFPNYTQDTVGIDPNGVNEFWGVGTHFLAPVMDFHIPFFGSSFPESDGSGTGFQTYLGSYLGREPSADECIQFTAARWTAIRNLQVNAATAYSAGSPAQGYYPMTDDGC